MAGRSEPSAVPVGPTAIVGTPATFSSATRAVPSSITLIVFGLLAPPVFWRSVIALAIDPVAGNAMRMMA